MFGFLKKRLKEEVKQLAKKVTVRELDSGDVDKFFADTETGLLQANVAVEVIDALKASLRKSLEKKEIKRGSAETIVRDAFRKALLEVFDAPAIDMEQLLKKKPALIVFLGFNGSGKTTSMAKLASWLQEQKHTMVFAAADTFRAASIEQVEHHAEKLGIKVVRHQYKADPAAVIFDAVKHAEAQGIDVVLADTAGRTHINANLIDELKKIVRVNTPDLKVLVIDSLTGNDAVEQAKAYDAAVGVDCLVLTKVDVNEKGGAILSAAHAIHKPILFLGIGQNYKDVELFDREKFVDRLL